MTNYAGAAEPGDIMVVDDMPANLTLLSNMLKQHGHRVRPFPSGKLALKAIELEPPDLVLLDINMPEMDGFEVCRILKWNPRTREIPVIFISAMSEPLDKVRAFGEGAVDYITKPFDVAEVEARVETHLALGRYRLRLEELVKDQVAEISESQLSTIFALSKLSESRDSETGRHLERVRLYCRGLATALVGVYDDIDEAFIQDIYSASPLHDIGKVAIPDHILLKSGRLTPEEFEVMKSHTVIGAQTLEAVRHIYDRNAFINMGISIARSHHEHWDGSGYPDGLKGLAIPLAARIMAVADVYDALRSRRCYKQASSTKDAHDAIVEGRGTQFEPRLVDTFLELESSFEAIGRDHGYDVPASSASVQEPAHAQEAPASAGSPVGVAASVVGF